MSVQFTLPSGKTFEVDFCDRNLNLLAHAQAIELDLGSECGGHGVCGKDRLFIAPEDQAKLSPLTDEERRLIKPADLARGCRLGCQSFPEESGATIRAVAPNSRSS